MDNSLREYKITCKLCGSHLIGHFDYPGTMYCPNILILDDSRCRNNYVITIDQVRNGTYNKEMFEVI